MTHPEQPQPERTISQKAMRLGAGIAATSAIVTVGSNIVRHEDPVGLVKAVAEGTLPELHQETIDFGPVQLPTAVHLTAKREGDAGSYRLVPSAESPTQSIGTAAEASFSEFDAPMPWSVDFDKGKEAKDTRQALEAIDDAISAIKKEQEAGFTCDVTIQGFASDEDDGQKQAGLGYRSNSNKKLAAVRGRAVNTVFERRAKAAGLDMDAELLAGEELVDKSRRPEINDIAEQNDEPILATVQRYNRDRGSFTKAELEILDELKDDRFARITVECTKESPTEAFSPARPLVEAIPASDTKKDDGSLILILVPISFLSIGDLARRAARRRSTPQARQSTGVTSRTSASVVPRAITGLPKVDVLTRPLKPPVSIVPVASRKVKDAPYKEAGSKNHREELGKKPEIIKQPRPRNMHGARHRFPQVGRNPRHNRGRGGNRS